MVTGDIPLGRRVRIWLGFEALEGFDRADLSVFLNQRACTWAKTHPATPLTEKPKRPCALHYGVFTVENNGGLPPVSVIEVGLAHGTATVVWAEIEIL